MKEKRNMKKGVSNTPHPAPRPATTKEREVEYYYCCDLICDLLIAGLTARAALCAAQAEAGIEFNENLYGVWFTPRPTMIVDYPCTTIIRNEGASNAGAADIFNWFYCCGKYDNMNEKKKKWF